ncbi:hypothetical protein [Mesorhizobium sophorae]|uniref:hypothetical protein n=1 Tax=Mesorhizobium sophorae TaxID=1300294 RepID=UPI000BA442F4|nr:hypothetical protein [Mesorhizobium sophorae]
MHIVLGWVFILGALAILGLQTVWFLQTGEWTPLSAMNLMQHFFEPEKSPWVFNPQSWIGLHRILEWLPSSFVAFFLGLFVVAAGD